MKNEIESNVNLSGVASSPILRRREPKPFWKAEWLRREYQDKKRSAAEIAAQFGACENTVLYFLAKHGIQRRTMSETRAVKKWSVCGKNNGMYGRCGDKNPRWIDGRSPLRQRIYVRSFWREIIEFVLKRDGFQCIRCGKKHSKTDRLQSHHVKSWTFQPNARFDLDNIVSVCATCHRWIHSLKNTKREYLQT